MKCTSWFQISSFICLNKIPQNQVPKFLHLKSKGFLTYSAMKYMYKLRTNKHSSSNIITNQTSSSNDFSNIKPESNFCSNQCIHTSFLDSQIKKFPRKSSIFQANTTFLDGRPLRHLWRKHLYLSIVPELGSMGLCFLGQIWNWRIVFEVIFLE